MVATMFHGSKTGLTNQDYIVSYNSDKTGPAVGSKLLSCDGVQPRQMMIESVFPFYGGHPDLESSFWKRAPLLLQGMKSRFRPSYKSCVFEYKGVKKEIALPDEDTSGNQS